VGAWETDLSGINGMVAPKGHEWDSMRGVQEGKFELVKVLLDHGANPNALLKKLPRRYGYATKSEPTNSSPLTLAASAGEPEIMHLLAKYGADPQHRPDNNLTPLMIAAGSGRVKWISRVSAGDSIEAIKAAVELGGDVNEVDSGGNTAMHAAAKLASLELIQYLADNGAIIDVENNEGLTPIYYAEHEYTAMTSVKIEDAPAAMLLRKLSIQVPDLVQKSINEWSSLSAEVRETIELLLQKELESLDEKDKP
jgi:ankyrin repeat protein